LQALEIHFWAQHLLHFDKIFKISVGLESGVGNLPHFTIDCESWDLHWIVHRFPLEDFVQGGRNPSCSERFFFDEKSGSLLDPVSFFFFLFNLYKKQ
jgi:hypothetical protein